MKTHNPENERLKRRYFTYLKEAKRYGESSLDGTAKALHRFETYMKFRPFKSFHIQQAIAFKKYLSEQTSQQTGKPLSKATLYGTLRALRDFFLWLAGQPGFRSKLSYADAEYFNLSEKDSRVAKAHRERRVPTMEQITHVIRLMSSATEIERRNRALIAFTILTGARDGAAASFKLKHLDLSEGLVRQDAREVKTKFSKSFTTWFFPVGDEIRQIVTNWVEYLRRDLLWGDDDPIFPATRVSLSAQRQFQADGLKREHWQTATPIRTIFRDAFTQAGLPYANPHSFRSTLAQLGERLCRTPEEFKAWSQNLGHEGVLTTFSSYGEVSANRQAAIIRSVDRPNVATPNLSELAQQLTRLAASHDGPSR